MGASTSRSNETSEDEEPNNNSGGTSTGAVIATAAAGAAVAWGVLKMLPDNTGTSRSNETSEDEEPNNNSGGTSTGAVIATAAAGAAVAWGVSKMLSDNTGTQERVLEGEKPMWSRPPQGRYKMNTDGGCSLKYEDRGPGYYGGILRDHHGKWVRGFRGYISESDTLASELHGILKGLELLDKHNLKQAILETDSQAAFQFVTGQDEYRRKSRFVNASWSMILECKALVEKNDITIERVPREYANQCADKLAKIAKVKKEEYVEIIYLPDELKELVERDAKFSG